MVYTKPLIALHWIIACLLPIQFLTGGSIERIHHAVHMGMAPAPWDVVQHTLHNYTGMVIGFLMGVRLLVRFVQPVTQKLHWSGKRVLATAMHLGLYAAIITQAAIGFVASYLTFSVAPLHVIGSYVILGMVALHFAAAAWHTLVKKDDTLDRIILPASSQPMSWRVRNAKTT